MKIFYIFVVIMLLTGCNINSDSYLINIPITSVPKVTGIIVTDETGFELDDWGIVPESERFNNLYAYPNPSPDFITFMFRIPSESIVNFYIVKALGPYDNKEQSQLYSQGSYISQSLIKVATLYDNHTFREGLYSVAWRSSDDNANPVSNGFYRAYLQIGNELIWRDILIARTKNDLPPGMPINLWIYE